MRTATIAILGVLAFAASANASDQRATSGHDWSGFYVGAHVGYGWGDVSTTTATTNDDVLDAFTGAPVLVNGTPVGFGGAALALDALVSLGIAGIAGTAIDFESDDEFDGWLGGATAGFNMQSGSFVFGIDGDFSATDFEAGSSATLEDDAAGVIFDGGIVDSLTASVATSIDWLSTVRGRVGFAFDRFLVFGTGGAAIAQVGVQSTFTVERVSLNTGNVATSTVSADDEDILLGWTVGGGVEFAVSENWSVKAEYQYVNLGDLEVDFGNAEVDVGIEDLQLVKVGVNYSF